MALDTLLGTVLMISTSNYNKKGGQLNGRRSIRKQSI